MSTSVDCEDIQRQKPNIMESSVVMTERSHEEECKSHHKRVIIVDSPLNYQSADSFRPHKTDNSSRDQQQQQQQQLLQPSPVIIRDDRSSTFSYNNRQQETKWEHLINALRPLFRRQTSSSSTDPSGSMDLHLDTRDYQNNELSKDNTSCSFLLRRVTFDGAAASMLSSSSAVLARQSKRNSSISAAVSISTSSQIGDEFTGQRVRTPVVSFKRQLSLEPPQQPVHADTLAHHLRLSSLHELISNFKLPKGLLRRKSSSYSSSSSSSISISNRRRSKMSGSGPLIAVDDLLCNSLFVPFLSVVRDENGERRMPAMLQFLRIVIRDSHDGDPENVAFHIDLQYGEIKWTVHRTLVDFLKLHSILNFRHFQCRLPGIPTFPSQLQYAFEKAKTFAHFSASLLGHDISGHEMRRARARVQRRKALQNYLERLARVCSGRSVHDLHVFLEMPNPALFAQSRWKGKDGVLSGKCVGGDQRIRKWAVIKLQNNWSNTKWFSLKDSFIAFFDSPASNTPTGVLMFDPSSKVERVNEFSQSPLKRHTLLISCGSGSGSSGSNRRGMKIRLDSERQLQEWRRAIEEAINQSPYCNSKIPFSSFAPVRRQKNSLARWFIDAQDFFGDVYESLLAAKHTIYISGWWLTPELHLKRPTEKYPDSRLDWLLKRKAEQGVRIYIIIYKEIEMALTIQSQHTKSSLQSLHQNIKVFRFPDHAPGGVLYWALHDKSIVIDNNSAYLGGLDLCLGRYDSSEHSVGEIGEQSGGSGEIWPGMDYSNPRMRDFRRVDQAHYLELIDRTITARMPWHDVHVMIQGQAARDVARHFVQRWNFIKSTKAAERLDLPYLLPPSDSTLNTTNWQHQRNQPQEQIQQQQRLNEQYEQQQRLNQQQHHHHQSQSELHSCELQILRSASSWSSGVETEQSILAAYLDCIQSAKHFLYIENQFFISNAAETDVTKQPSPSTPIASSSTQPPASSPAQPLSPQPQAVKNTIAKALVDRIRLAHSQGRTFRVYVVLPLLPAFESEVSEVNCGTVRLILHYHLQTICRGESSIAHQLQRSGIDWRRYISFSSLRNHGPLNNGHGPMVSEQIYVHSKLLIADDRVAIIGSANINDRSMLGHRDGELAVLIRDTETVSTTLNGNTYQAGRFVNSLRRSLFCEHLGIAIANRNEHILNSHSQNNLIDWDICSEEFFRDRWLATAASNTRLYRTLFRCLPDDTVRSWPDFQQYIEHPYRPVPGHLATTLPPDEVQELLSRIQGYLVEFPTQFMSDHNLSNIFPAKEFVLPVDLFI